MAFKFKLEKALQVRKSIRDVAQRDFQEAAREVVLAEEELAALKDSIWQSELSRGEVAQGSGGHQGVRLQQTHEFIELVKIKIERQLKKIERLQSVAEEKRTVLAEKAIEVKTLERLKEKKKATYRAERIAADAAELDDLLVMRHSREEA